MLFPEVKEADLLIYSDNTLAMAFKYDTEDGPIVISKASQPLTQHLKNEALYYNIPIFQRTRLVSNLKDLNIGDELPRLYWKKFIRVLIPVLKGKSKNYTVKESNKIIITKKVRFIKRLVSLSKEEKECVITFFSNHPNYENLIDWNKKNLIYNDFEKVFSIAQKSRKAQKYETEQKPDLLFKGHNCKIINQTEDYIIVSPLDWECAVYFSSFSCGGDGGKWCIGWKNNRDFWDWYSKNYTLFFIYFLKRHPALGKKIVVMIDHGSNDWYLYLQDNKTPWDIISELPDRLDERKIENVFNFCWKLWYYHLQSEMKRCGQLYLDLIDSLETVDDEIPDATFMKNVIPLLLYYDNMKYNDYFYVDESFDDLSSMDFIYELTGEISKSQLQLMYMLYLKQNGYNCWIDSYGDVKFKIEKYTYRIVIDEKDPKYFSIVCYNFWKVKTNEEKKRVALITSNINEKKIVKIYLNKKENNTNIKASTFLAKPIDFEIYFKRMLEIIATGKNDFIKEIKNPQFF